MHKGKKMKKYEECMEVARSAVADRYEILGFIENGSYSTIFKARRRLDDMEVAIKCVFDLDAGDETVPQFREFRKRILREVSILIHCAGSECCPELYDIVITRSSCGKVKHLFMIMQLFETDLETLTYQSRNFFEFISRPDVRKEIIFQLACCLCTIHSAGIVHRDLASKNCLISYDNEDWVVKVTDFNLSKSDEDRDPSAEPQGASRRPHSTHFVCSSYYAAPELCCNCKTYSFPVDMWALGCIIGEMTRGEPLFGSRTYFEVFQKIVKFLGPPESVLDTGGDEKAYAFAANLLGETGQKVKDMDWKYHFRFATEGELDILRSLLKYRPEHRLTARQLTKHPYFDDIRQCRAPGKLNSFTDYYTVCGVDERFYYNKRIDELVSAWRRCKFRRKPT